MEEKHRLEAVWYGCLLSLEVGHGVAYRVRIDNVSEVVHDGRGREGCVVVVGKVGRGRLAEVSPEEKVSRV